MRLLAALLLLPVLSPLSLAQTFQPKTIAFTGAPGFTQAELLAATHLTPGAPLTPDQVKSATQSFADTGLFTDVRYRSDGQSLTFALTPATALLPARYANFPWWTDASLTAELSKRVPLFHGSVPLAGTLQEQLVLALQTLLAEKQIKAAVEALPESDPGTSELRAISFHISEPRILVGAVSFPGAGPEWSDALSQVARADAGKEYGATDSATALRQAVLHVYLAKGYAEAAITAIAPGAPVAEAGKVLVPFTVAVEPGAQYRLGSFLLVGSTLVDPATFLKAAPLKPGEIVEEDKLRRSLLVVTGPYADKGYIDARVSALPVFEKEKHLVNYNIRVTPASRIIWVS